MAAGCQPGFDRTGNSVIQLADHENPTLEPNMQWIGSPVAGYGHSKFDISWRVHLGPPFWGKGRPGAIDRIIWESDDYCLYALHCDHCANYTAAICHRMSGTLKSRGGGSLWVKILGCSLWSRSWCWGSHCRKRTPQAD